MPRPTRQLAEVERIRVHIQDGAARAFARSGYRAATMAMIAKEAGYSTPTLYSYFRGKQAIFRALSDQVLGELYALFDAAEPAGLTFRQRVELLLTRQLELVDRRRDVFTFFLNVIMTGDGPPAPRENQRAYEDRLTAWLRTSLEQCHDAPLESPEVIATMMNGLGHAFVSQRLAQRPPQATADLAPVITRLLFTGCSPPVS